MQPEKSRGKILTRRALLLAGGQVALLGALAARLYDLQFLDSDRFTLLSDENRINIRLLAPPRGLIVDRFGVQLAANQPTYRVVVVEEQAGDINATLDAIAALIPVSDADRHRVLRDIHRKHSFVPIAIRENLTWDEMARIEVNTLDIPGVSIEQGLARSYPFGDTASHVVGYVAAVNEEDLSGDDPLLELPDFRIGKNGVEKAFDLELRGTAGTSQIEVNAVGRVVRELAHDDGAPGQQVTLGLDMELQDLAAQRCAAQGSAACVMLDAWTGEVMVLASSPGYDPSAFAAGLTPQQWNDLVANPLNPLGNKAISGTYSPGSTFKPLVAMTALEAGILTTDTEFSCPGFFELGNSVFHCWKKGGHGRLSVRRAITESCDVFFYHTADLLGIDRISAMAHRFGLGGPLGIEIPGEHAGLIPNTVWKKRTTGVSWQRGETVSCGIGQSFILVTPLQLATYAARLVTSRQIVPRLVRAQGPMQPDDTPLMAPKDDFASLGLTQSHLDLVLNAMYGVVNEPRGTAFHARIIDAGFEMGGKTGTAQVHHITEAERAHGHLTGESVPWKQRDHALFIGFAPVTAPRYVCAVVVEHGGAIGGEGGAVAAPIAHDVLLEAQKRDSARKIPPQPFAPPQNLAQG